VFFPGPPAYPNISSYISNCQPVPELERYAWHDVVRIKDFNTLRLRFQAGMRNNQGEFLFDLTGAPYMYHCHMLEHEENDLMQGFSVKNGPNIPLILGLCLGLGLGLIVLGVGTFFLVRHFMEAKRVGEADKNENLDANENPASS
jgi:hypothetical protein